MAFSAIPQLGATAITIVNPSFEANAQAAIRGFNTVAPTGWTMTSGGGGTFRPSANEFNTPAAGLMSVASNNIPDGINTAYSNAADFAQILGTLIDPTPGNRYDLTVWVGDRWDASLPSYTIELRAGGALLNSTTNPVVPANGQFSQALVSYTALGGEAGALEIRLINNGAAQINWDNVQLELTEAAIPEPGTAGLLLFGLGAAFVAHRRRRSA